MCKTAHSIDVIDRHVHEGEVDLHSGHLNMLGSLVVKGDVHGTFGVNASGDIEIRGSVDNGHVHGGGDVRIHRGVRGSAGTVFAEGNLIVHHAESATLYARKLLQIGEALHSKLSAARVEVTGKLRGGVTSAEYSVVVREAGSPQAKSTEIVLAEPLEPPAEAAKRQLERAKVVRSKGLTTSASKGGATDREKGGKLGRCQASLQDAETQRLAQRARRREQLRAVAFVELRLAHAGVSIRVGDTTLVLDAGTPASRFMFDPETRGIIRTRIKP